MDYSEIPYTPVTKALPQLGGMYAVIATINDPDPLYFPYAAEYLPETKAWGVWVKVVAWAEIPMPTNPEYKECVR